jgi:hypothetical protein
MHDDGDDGDDDAYEMMMPMRMLVIVIMAHCEDGDDVCDAMWCVMHVGVV